MSNSLRKISKSTIILLCFALFFSSLKADLIFAEEISSNQITSNSTYLTYVEDGFYTSVDEAVYWEELNELEYTIELEEIESEYAESYEEVYLDVPEFMLERVEDDNPELIMSEPSRLSTAELNALPFLLPVFYAIVVRQGGKLVVKQTLKNGTKWIAIKNQHLAGKTHLVSGIKFDLKGFPIFKSQFTMTLKNDLLKSSNYIQFKSANTSLRNQLSNSSTLRSKFTLLQKQDIAAGKTPRGYVWHHHQNRGVMQLVPKLSHELTGHTGGKAIWGQLYSSY